MRCPISPAVLLKKEFMDQAIKHDTDKNRLELLSPLWLFGVGRVLTFGARKYADFNWAKGDGLKLTRTLGAALRHIFAVLNGEDLDPESGLHHLDHASCELMFARHLWETKRETTDDRVKESKQHSLKPPISGNEDKVEEIVFVKTEDVLALAKRLHEERKIDPGAWCAFPGTTSLRKTK